METGGRESSGKEAAEKENMVMAKLELTSNITFLYYSNMEEARRFFEETLGLPVAYDPGWAVVYRLRDKAYVGAVDVSEGSISVAARGGVLISLTVSNIEEVHAQLAGAFGVEGMSEIKQVKEMALKSFFFTGPEGYKFEVEQFSDGELNKIF